MIDLRQMLIDTFKNSDIPEEIDELKIGDIEEWDSLGNFNLLLSIEQTLDIQFDMESMEKLTSIEEIKKEIENVLSER
jgi:acyl carrier protein|tara:strand:+ start:905 stop:1138 length:234 start_codon:yes stop_codon:yes gene_type:complete